MCEGAATLASGPHEGTAKKPETRQASDSPRRYREHSLRSPTNSEVSGGLQTLTRRTQGLSVLLCRVGELSHSVESSHSQLRG